MSDFTQEEKDFLVKIGQIKDTASAASTTTPEPTKAEDK
jgi:hypothetical protein